MDEGMFKQNFTSRSPTKIYIRVENTQKNCKNVTDMTEKCLLVQLARTSAVHK